MDKFGETLLDSIKILGDFDLEIVKAQFKDGCNKCDDVLKKISECKDIEISEQLKELEKLRILFFVIIHKCAVLRHNYAHQGFEGMNKKIFELEEEILLYQTYITESLTTSNK